MSERDDTNADDNASNGTVMQLDLSAYLRLDAASRLDASSAGAAFATSTGDMLEISSFGPGVFRVRVGPDTRPDYGLVVGRAQRCEQMQLADQRWSFAAGDARLELASKPATLRLLRGNSCILASATHEDPSGRTRLPAIGRSRDAGSWMASFGLASGEPIYGLGEKSGPLNNRGQIVRSRVADASGVDEFATVAVKGAPFCWSPGSGAGAWGIFVHTPGRVVHGVGFPDWSQRSYALQVVDEALDVFLIAGHDPAQLLDRYTALTGRPAAVPAWSLGLWVSTSSQQTVEDAGVLAADLRQRRIPCDVLTLSENALWDAQTRFDFQWDEQRGIDPAGAIDRIAAHGLRVCAWEHPYVSVYSPLFIELAAKRYLLTDDGGAPFVFGGESDPDQAIPASVLAELPESGIIDFTNPDAYAWWRDAHEPLFNAGIVLLQADGGAPPIDDAVAFNGDRGARLHNVYPLLYQRCVFDATRKFSTREQGPALILAATAWTGAQRSPLQAGDAMQSDWEGLAASVRGGLASGMSGLPYFCSEVGGAYGAGDPSPELCVRWLQMSVFASHLIASGSGARAPWGHDGNFEAIARQWLEFRYRLFPYLRSALVQSTAHGMPLMRAMPLAFPHNALTRTYETQFMCGDALLVAPIIAPGGEVDVALPPGAWYDLATRQRVAGRQVIRYRAPLDRFPVFGREGHALPLGPAVRHAGELNVEKPLDALWIFGKPSVALDAFAQAKITIETDGAVIAAAPGVAVEIFGDAGKITNLPLD